MGKVLLNDTILPAIAGAIRDKTGGSDTIKPVDMPTAISGISGGGEEYNNLYQTGYIRVKANTSTGLIKYGSLLNIGAVFDLSPYCDTLEELLQGNCMIFYTYCFSTASNSNLGESCGQVFLSTIPTALFGCSGKYGNNTGGFAFFRHPGGGVKELMYRGYSGALDRKMSYDTVEYSDTGLAALQVGANYEFDPDTRILTMWLTPKKGNEKYWGFGIAGAPTLYIYQPGE